TETRSRGVHAPAWVPRVVLGGMPCYPSGSLHDPAREGEAVADGKHQDFHTFVAAGVLVELVDEDVQGFLRVEYRAVPQGVVHGNKAAFPDPGDDEIPIGDVIFLVGVDEGEVEVAFDRLERVESLTEDELDFFTVGAVFPAAL